MADLIITRSGPGVTLVSSADPFSSLVVHRIARDPWKETPAEPGVYVLWGVVQEKAAMYIGMSTTDMRSRIRQHHVSARKNWFGTLFAIPLSSALCRAVEAELLQRVGQANVIGLIKNRATEERWLNAEVVHVEPAVDAIVEAVEMLIGTEAFTGQGDESSDDEATVDNVERVPPLSRVSEPFRRLDSARSPFPAWKRSRAIRLALPRLKIASVRSATRRQMSSGAG
jgi:hypothetical protein